MKTGIAAEQLRSLISRVQRLEAKRAVIDADIRATYAEAKGCGFDVAAMREVIKAMNKDRADLSAHDAQVRLYRESLGIT